ncbi:hypothetical protein LIER_39616 [Lithospermum erythrorhizon]|uniref:Uncharacterized protein n=1 Tax=Lithospermum erythrorhizon TaxID=34254 RepID=A0AAV3QHJ3_LITER
MIQGFNHGGQRGMGKVSINLVIGELEITSWFYPIDSKATYNVLLGRPRIYNSNVVPSPLHHCLKYCKDGMEGTIKEDENPFTTEEAHFADAKIYQRKKMDSPQPKEGAEAPKAVQPKPPNKEEEVIEAHKGLTLPLIQGEKVASTTLKGFVTPVEGPKIEHGTMNPKAYDLLVKEGYDPTKDATMSRSVPEVKEHGLNENQEKLQRKGYSIKNSTAGLENASKPPLRILFKRMVNQSPKDTTGEAPLERQIPYQPRGTPRKWGAVPWVYPTETERRNEKTKQLKTQGHKQSTRPHKLRPIRQWRVVQTPQVAKRVADSSLHITIDGEELSPKDAIEAPSG